MRVQLIESIEGLIDYYNNDSPENYTEVSVKEMLYLKNNEILAILNNLLKVLDPHQKDVLD